MSQSRSAVDAVCAIDGEYDDADERIATLRDRVPPDETLGSQERVFKALGNEKRLRILHALREGEHCVCELEILLDAPQSTVATHLRKLRDAGLVTSRKRGKWRFYRLADGAVIDFLDLAADVQPED